METSQQSLEPSQAPDSREQRQDLEVAAGSTNDGGVISNVGDQDQEELFRASSTGRVEAQFQTTTELQSTEHSECDIDVVVHQSSNDTRSQDKTPAKDKLVISQRDKLPDNLSSHKMSSYNEADHSYATFPRHFPTRLRAYARAPR